MDRPEFSDSGRRASDLLYCLVTQGPGVFLADGALEGVQVVTQGHLVRSLSHILMVCSVQQQKSKL